MTDDHDAARLRRAAVAREGRERRPCGTATRRTFPAYTDRGPPGRRARQGRVAVLGHTTGSHLGLPDEEEQELTLFWLAEVCGGPGPILDAGRGHSGPHVGSGVSSGRSTELSTGSRVRLRDCSPSCRFPPPARRRPAPHRLARLPGQPALRRPGRLHPLPRPRAHRARPPGHGVLRASPTPSSTTRRSS